MFAETILRISAEYEGSEQSSGTGSAVIRAALSKKLAAKGTTVEELIAREHSTRISMGISAGNAIKSLHGLNSLDWDKITSVLCVTEQILNRDPSGNFQKNDLQIKRGVRPARARMRAAAAEKRRKRLR